MGFPLWVVGVLMSILASFCNTTGLLLQKFAHQRLAEEAKEREDRRSRAPSAAAAGDASIGAIMEEDEEADSSSGDGEEAPAAGKAAAARSSSHQSLQDVELAEVPDAPKKATVAAAAGVEPPRKKGRGRGRSVFEDDESGAPVKKGKAASEGGAGEDEEGDEEEEEVAGFWRHPVWVLGFGMVVIGALLDVATFGFAPQSLLAPIASMSLVFNTLLAPRFLGESLSLRDILATGVIVIGTVVVVVFAPHETPEYTVDDMRDLYTRPVTIVFFIVNGGVMVLLFLITGKFSVDSQPHGVWKTIYPFSFPTIAGVFGGMSVLFSKCGIEMVKTSVSTENQFVYPEPYVFIVLIAVFLFLQVKFLNLGLALFDALYVIPVYQVWWMISGILGGSFFFDEFRNFDTMQWIFFPVGTAINIVGIYILTQRGGSDDEAAAEEAEALGAAEAGSKSPSKSPSSGGLSRAARKQVVALDAQRRASMLFFGVDNSAVAAMGQHERVENLSFAVASPIKPAIRRVSRMMHRTFASVGPAAAAPRAHSRRSSAMAAPSLQRLQSAERREAAKQRRHSEMPSLSRPGSTESQGTDAGGLLSRPVSVSSGSAARRGSDSAGDDGRGRGTSMAVDREIVTD